ncbi:MAG: hypothetical protein ABIH92_01215 [Nanoarchaeota archaeon]
MVAQGNGRYLTSLEDLKEYGLSGDKIRELGPVVAMFRIKTTPYYASLANFSDPTDQFARLILRVP